MGSGPWFRRSFVLSRDAMLRPVPSDSWRNFGQVCCVQGLDSSCFALKRCPTKKALEAGSHRVGQIWHA